MAKILFTLKEVQEYLETVEMAECRFHDYDYESKDCSEDPVAQVFTVEDAVAYLMENPAYNRGGEEAGYLLVIFDENNYIGEVVF